MALAQRDIESVTIRHSIFGWHSGVQEGDRNQQSTVPGQLLSFVIYEPILPLWGQRRLQSAAMGLSPLLLSSGRKRTSCHMIAVRSERAVRRVWDWPSPSVYWPTPTTGSFGNYNNNNTASTLILMVPVDFERGRRKKKNASGGERTSWETSEDELWVIG